MPGIKAVAIGRAARRSPVTRRTRRLRGLRTNSFAISVMLLVQYGLGMGVNLYARVPAAGQGAGIIAALGRALISRPAYAGRLGPERPRSPGRRLRLRPPR